MKENCRRLQRCTSEEEGVPWKAMRPQRQIEVTQTKSGRSSLDREHVQRAHSRKELVSEELEEGPLGKEWEGRIQEEARLLVDPHTCCLTTL